MMSTQRLSHSRIFKQLLQVSRTNRKREKVLPELLFDLIEISASRSVSIANIPEQLRKSR